ncbi:hypothetical protein AFV6_gp28 [Betalipothrixvirus pozzuoliense]|uniref:Uncharacterized protein n=1 Tax=Betalipothrixvirus pozzuoliense TaxID=346882 RepID=A7WKI2_9VIRU|nr:hypothetical protein AFV6_gp28 [Acidianus filamentous virus 6]CAJ31582.1 conserved hypothetical protein [Acidianus filamentous virus 6]
MDDRVYYLIKLLLYVAKQEKARVTPTKLQKIFFLLEKEKGIDLGLDFKPFIFGPSSDLLQDYVNKLVEMGEIEEKARGVRDVFTGFVIAYRRRYILKSEFTPNESDEEIMKFFKKWVRKSTDKILKYVYKKYPESFYHYPYRLFDPLFNSKKAKD